METKDGYSPDTNPDYEKPPLEVTPEEIFNYQIDRNRILTLLSAITEYISVGRKPNIEWLHEVERRLGRIWS